MKRFAPVLLVMVALLALALPSLASAPSATRPSVRINESVMPLVTQRQKVFDELKLRLGMISTETPPLADGYQYQTDVGKNPIDDWPTEYQQEELKAAKGKARLGLFDLVEKRQKDTRESRKIIAKLPLQVRIFHYRELTPEELRIIMSDVMRAIVTNRDTGEEETGLGKNLFLNGLAHDISPDESGFIVPKETFSIDGAAVGFDVYYVVKPFQA